LHGSIETTTARQLAKNTSELLYTSTDRLENILPNFIHGTKLNLPVESSKHAIILKILAGLTKIAVTGEANRQLLEVDYVEVRGNDAAVSAALYHMAIFNENAPCQDFHSATKPSIKKIKLDVKGNNWNTWNDIRAQFVRRHLAYPWL
jgi:hypothetical protein